MKIQANLNDYIYVKLTPYGISLMEKEYERIYKDTYFTRDEIPKVKIDEDGYTQFQIWQFMAQFGKHMHCGMADMPYEMNILIEEAR